MEWVNIVNGCNTRCGSRLAKLMKIILSTGLILSSFDCWKQYLLTEGNQLEKLISEGILLSFIIINTLSF